MVDAYIIARTSQGIMRVDVVPGLFIIRVNPDIAFYNPGRLLIL